MRILFFSYWFPPEIGAQSARIYENAKLWIKNGHAVTVITGFPNYPTGIISKEYGGKVFQKEVMAGIQVLRTWVYPSANERLIKRSLNFVSAMLSSVLFALNPFVSADVVVGSSPQLLTAFAAYIISRIKRKPFVFEVRDLWPQVIVELGLLKKGPIINWLRKLEKLLYVRATRIIVVTESFKDYIVNLGIDGDKVDFIPNGVDLSFWRESVATAREDKRTELNLKGKFVVLYCGNHGMAQGLEIILKAAEILQENKEVFFLLVGDGPEKKALQDVAEKNRLRNIAFLPSQPKDKVADFYQAADVCLVPLKAVEFLGKFIPSKMFEIMACGRPMIASLAGEAQEIINKSGAGIVAPPGNFSKLAEAIIYMLNHEDKRSEMAEAGKRFVETNYNREQLALTYLKSLNLAQAKTR